jgi:dethiobiotin synthetase
MRGCLVTGTDTGIGKTLITCAFLTACRQRGLSAVGMKPVAAGVTDQPGGHINDDVEAIVAASSIAANRELVNPYLFAPPIAPHIAAADSGTVIDGKHIVTCLGQLAAMADVVVVEGVGGFRVPLHGRFDTADLAVEIGLPVVMVVGLRLGCINHALITAEAIQARKLPCVGWVANQVDAHMPRLHENISTLDELLDMPRLGFVEHMAQPDARIAASRIRLPDELVG